MRVLKLRRPNMKGSDVRYLVKCLMRHGFSDDYRLARGSDSVYDAAIMSCVVDFQIRAGIPGTYGVVDDVVWHALNSDGPLRDASIPPQVAELLFEAGRLIGTPAIIGATNPSVGLDSAGFIIWLLSKIYNVPHLVDMPCDKIWRLVRTTCFKGRPSPGDIIFYGQSDKGPATHIMIAINTAQVIGAVGATNATINREIAFLRSACVKVKPLNYRAAVLGGCPPDLVALALKYGSEAA